MQNVKEKFHTWLSQGRAKKYRPDACVACMEATSAWAVQKNLTKVEFWKILDGSVFNSIRVKLSKDKIFRKSDGKNHKAFEKIGLLYSQFLREMATKIALEIDVEPSVEVAIESEEEIFKNEITIADAVVKVLLKQKQPMFARDICREIVAAEHYKFNSKAPIDMVYRAIRACCEGVDMPNQGVRIKKFKIVLDSEGKQQYALIDYDNILFDDGETELAENEHAEVAIMSKSNETAGSLIWNDAVAQSFKDYLIAQGKAEGTAASYRSSMNWVVSNFSDIWQDAQPRGIATKAIYFFIQEVLKDDKFNTANATAHNQYSAALNQFLNYINNASGKVLSIEVNAGTTGNDDLQKRINMLLKSKSIEGMWFDDIAAALCEKKTVLRRALDSMPEIIEVPGGCFVHCDKYVDLNEAKQTMSQILSKLFLRFGGYANSRVLYDEVQLQLDIFLNDNNLEDEKKIYWLAKHFFNKVSNEGFVFYDNQIWESEPIEGKTQLGLMIRLASRNNGFLDREKAKEYLSQLKTSTGVLQAASIGWGKHDFVLYSKDEIFYLAAANMDAEIISRIKSLLDSLFDEATGEGFIVLKDISPDWLMRLPQLPLGKPWTELMLQEVIATFHEMGYKTVSTGLKQDLDTVHAAIVNANDNSRVTFADVVWEFVAKSNKLPMDFSAEALRLKIRDAKMISGGELINNMHDALKDHRFVWTNSNGQVRVLSR